jgi:aspartate-semialdehyde dehydrogenase
MTTGTERIRLEQIGTGPRARIGVVGATGAVGAVTLALVAERGYEDVRAFASARSAGTRVSFGESELVVEEATPEALGAGDVDLFLFSVGTSASRELVPAASAGGALCVDKSSAYRLVDGYPLVVPEVNGNRALGALDRDRVVANPNCCTIPLTCVLRPLHEAVGLARVRVATYQSVSGAGAHRMTALARERPEDHDLAMDWTWEGDESDEEAKLRAETRKILELPELPISATCVRVPVMVGHSEAVWIELDQPLAPDEAAAVLRAAPGLRVLDLPDFPTPAAAVGRDDVLVGRIRQDGASQHGLALYLSCDNLRKGAALNAIQIAELLLGAAAPTAR